jgi:anti-anti-sigma regulatory factor
MRKKKKESLFKSEKSKKITLRRRNPFYNKIYATKRSQSKYDNDPFSRIPEILKAPAHLSIQFNTEETLEFFQKLQSILHQTKNIFLDMSDINQMSEDAILYLLSRLEYFTTVYPQFIVTGSVPKDKVCRDILIDSNFLKYVKAEIKFHPKENVFPIESGFESDGRIVAKLLNFISKIFPFVSDNKERIYDPIMESLTNTKNHAYKIGARHKRWWVTVFPDKNDPNRVHITTLDNGLGIPATIQKNWRERVQAQSSKIGLSDINDCALIESALLGGFRTRTEQIERGTGLPTIFNATELDQVDNLNIISNNAYISIENKNIIKKTTLKNKFHGTLLSWDIVRFQRGIK